MTEDTTKPDIPEETSPTPPRVPWYSLNPKHLRFSKFTWWFLGIAGTIILFSLVTAKPLWIWGWQTHLYCASQLGPVKSASGKTFKSGAWAKAKRIVVYGAPGIDEGRLELAYIGMRDIVNELGLDFTVESIPLPKDAEASITASVVRNPNGTESFDFDIFVSRRLDDRGDQFGEMVVVDCEFADPSWAFGLTSFADGVAVLQQPMVSDDGLGRHEGTHLVGYDKHDDVPFYILGYRENLVPQNRDTLMMLLPKPSNELSPRARDAVINFWKGMERMSGRKYLKTPGN